MLPSSSDLTYFLEVAQTGNLSRAAERLGISQPSLTLAMQRLEECMKSKLLLRGKKGVSLTRSGKQLSLQTQELLQKWRSIQDRATSSEENVEGRFSLGCHPSVALFTLPLFLPKLLSDHPGLEISLFHDLSRKVTERVIRMDLDLGIVVNPVKHPDLVIRKLCDDEVTFWSSKKATMKEALGMQLLCDPDLLQSQSLLKRTGTFKKVITSSSLEVIAKLTEKGTGVGILPTRVVKANCDGALYRVTDAPSFKDEISLIYRVEQRGVRAIQEIVSQIQGSIS